jgi:hypothetical protein
MKNFNTGGNMQNSKRNLQKGDKLGRETQKNSYNVCFVFSRFSIQSAPLENVARLIFYVVPKIPPITEFGLK